MKIKSVQTSSWIALNLLQQLIKIKILNLLNLPKMINTITQAHKLLNPTPQLIQTTLTMYQPCIL